MTQITIKNLRIQFDGATGIPLMEQVKEILEQINLVLAREPYGLDAQITNIDHITRDDVIEEPSELEDSSLWLRLGDYGEYEDFGQDFDALGLTLLETGISSADIFLMRDRGFETRGFFGDNYISLYWGDTDGNFVRNLDTEELNELKSCMVSVTNPALD